MVNKHARIADSTNIFNFFHDFHVEAGAQFINKNKNLFNDIFKIYL